MTKDLSHHYVCEGDCPLPTSKEIESIADSFMHTVDVNVAVGNHCRRHIEIGMMTMLIIQCAAAVKHGHTELNIKNLILEGMLHARALMAEAPPEVRFEIQSPFNLN